MKSEKLTFSTTNLLSLSTHNCRIGGSRWCFRRFRCGRCQLPYSTVSISSSSTLGGRYSRTICTLLDNNNSRNK